LQSGCDASPSCTPSGTVFHQIPETDKCPSDLPALADPLLHNVVDAVGSDASQSSHEYTDASSVESLDILSAEKPKSKKSGYYSLKVAISRKRKSVTTPTSSVAAAVFDKSPEAYRRSSAPQDRSSTTKPCSGQPSEDPSKFPITEKPVLHMCKSGPTSPTAEKSQQNGELDMVDKAALEAPQTAPILMHKTDGKKLFVRMNRKLRSYMRFTSKIPDRRHGDVRVPVVDLTSEDVPVTPSVVPLTYSELLRLGTSHFVTGYAVD